MPLSGENYTNSIVIGVCSISNGCCRYGNVSTGAKKRRCFNSTNAFCWNSYQKKLFFRFALCNLTQSPSVMIESQHEPSIKIAKAQKVVNLCQSGWGQPILNELDISWIHMHTFLINDVTQILDLSHAKGVFLQVGTQFVPLQGLKYLPNVLQVLFQTLVEDEDVVQIYNHKQVGKGLQDIINQHHKSCRGIFQPKMHDQPLKKALLRFEGGILYMYVLAL